jgi:hypothetical protein
MDKKEDENLENVIEWLLNSEPWVEYRTRLDLLNETLDSEDVIKAKNKTIEDERIRAILNNWEKSSGIHPYMFYMGTDFRKLKAPFIWYDILNVSDVLSQSGHARADIRFIEMVDLIKTKPNIEGKYIPESVWLSWKEWDFGQKKKPSAWLTLLVMRILKRTGAI